MNEPVSLAASERWTIPSGGEGPGLRIALSHPAGRVTGPVPVLLLLDGDFMHLTATEFVRTVNLVTVGDFPPVAVVGIMRDETHPGRYVSSRFRDFTPHEWVLHGPFAADNAMASMGTGGAPDLLAAIERDVVPQVRDRLGAVDVDVGDLAIGGWSLSGLFASWAWLERPDLFAHLLAISPSLWWHDASLLTTPFATRPAGQKAFVCVGAREEGDVALVYPPRFAHAAQREMAAMVRNADRFAAMAAAAGADVMSLALPDEHHVTVQAAALSHGLRHLFA